jgi:hypothetical protein
MNVNKRFSSVLNSNVHESHRGSQKTDLNDGDYQPTIYSDSTPWRYSIFNTQYRNNIQTHFQPNFILDSTWWAQKHFIRNFTFDDGIQILLETFVLITRNMCTCLATFLYTYFHFTRPLSRSLQLILSILLGNHRLQFDNRADSISELRANWANAM